MSTRSLALPPLGHAPILTALIIQLIDSIIVLSQHLRVRHVYCHTLERRRFTLATFHSGRLGVVDPTFRLGWRGWALNKADRSKGACYAYNGRLELLVFCQVFLGAHWVVFWSWHNRWSSVGLKQLFANLHTMVMVAFKYKEMV